MTEESKTEENIEIDQEKLRELATMANHLVNCETQLEQMQKQLTDKKAEIKRVSEELIPDIFAEMGLREITLENGTRISVAKYYSGSISKKNEDMAFAWLAKHNHDGIIKNVVACDFGKGEDQPAKELMSLLGQPGTQRQVILDDSVVSDGKFSIGAEVRVRVYPGRLAVSGPTGVANGQAGIHECRGSRQRSCQFALQFDHFAGGFYAQQ